MRKNTSDSRRNFIKRSGMWLAGGLLLPDALAAANAKDLTKAKTKVSAHLWVYASAFPPNWDATPVLETVFFELKYAGFDGVELMEINLRNNDAVERIGSLINKHKLAVTGTSYGANMWDINKHDEILEDVQLVVPRLSKLKGKTFGISVGSAGRVKTEAELDAQAALLQEIIKVCKDNSVEPNLHNHTYEVENNMHDLKGTLARIPDIKLGPDVNWLIRGGVDPVEFIETYGKQMTYIHLRDEYADGRWTEYLGQGATDFKGIAKALKDQGFQGDAAVELAFPSDLKPVNPLKTDWKLSRDFVRKTFGW